ncbi:hypothetical protein RHGRI_031569 [Rhododendron griersonianum]|uniref:Uncharacterized protein n=1 Tax=Rhododendron griersonianum TaxID=479676 RepID=A0AAV6IE51_9ERIC|nr:hypothetical protein RHGRI_031569 [Rhododendron griersonianum]
MVSIFNADVTREYVEKEADLLLEFTGADTTAVYDHHPRPKQLIVENDLPQILPNLIEERRDGQRSGGQVSVKQMATSLLKALHINAVS